MKELIVIFFICAIVAVPIVYFVVLPDYYATAYSWQYDYVNKKLKDNDFIVSKQGIKFREIAENAYKSKLTTGDYKKNGQTL